MLIRSLIVAIAASSLTLAAVPALASEVNNALDRVVESENWPLAIELVDRLIEERGGNDELLAYRARLVGLNTRTMLAETSDPQSVNVGQTTEVIDPVSERVRERETFFANRAARLAARDARRQRRNQVRLLNAEIDYWRARSITQGSRLLLNAEIDYWRARSRTRGSRLLGTPVLVRRPPYSRAASSALARRISPQRASLSQTTDATDSQMTEREAFLANRAARLAAREARHERRLQERLLNAEIALLRDRRRR